MTHSTVDNTKLGFRNFSDSGRSRLEANTITVQKHFPSRMGSMLAFSGVALVTPSRPQQPPSSPLIGSQKIFILIAFDAVITF